MQIYTNEAGEMLTAKLRWRGGKLQQLVHPVDGGVIQSHLAEWRDVPIAEPDEAE